MLHNVNNPKTDIKNKNNDGRFISKSSTKNKKQEKVFNANKKVKQTLKQFVC